MTVKTTPGPWTVHIDYGKACLTIFDEDGNYGDTSVETQDANARIVAAAPALLQSVQELLDLHIAHHNEPAHAAARAVVAKAMAAR